MSKKAPAYSFQEKSRRSAKENCPGSGAYEPKPVHLKNQPKFTFSGKIDADFSSNNHTPAPEAYNPDINQVLVYSAKVNFPKAKRAEVTSKDYNLGPGQYEIEQSKTKNRGYMFLIRKGVTENSNEIPGPGSYDVNGTTMHLKKNVAPYLQSKNKAIEFETKVPGPGQYNANPNVV